MIDFNKLIGELKFDKDGLIPAIIVDVETGAVLTLAHMSEESLRISIDEGKTCFWSRSRNELWRKGETSGNFQHIISITTDCDKDALVVTVKKKGPACHTGAESCFFEDMYRTDSDDIVADDEAKFSATALHEIIKDRKINRVPGSYTTYLFEKGIDKILKKIGEETAEVIIAAKGDDKEQTIYELSDLLYHSLVLMTEMGISIDDIKKELASRHLKAKNDD